MDLHTYALNVTYTDDGGTERNAYAYLTEQGGDGMPFGSWEPASRWATYATVLFAMSHYGEDTVDGLDGCASLVVNGSDELRYALVNYCHEVGATERDVIDWIGGTPWTCTACEARNLTDPDHYGNADYCRNCHADNVIAVDA